MSLLWFACMLLAMPATPSLAQNDRVGNVLRGASGQQTLDIHGGDDALLRHLQPCCSSCTTSACFANCNPNCVEATAPRDAPLRQLN
ncbi:unnamed protein product [Vitrella brassicaformis CCMP3155]|uniref:SREBP regulating gene protein n=1 Tax=Vitrella brassicaformis (strain CCMP3155) TaxID=1169540 RepID=A0A0G4GR70_VITBC|nr:unnamed protein product [Vitrella brassicaformis CCMP3155]|eukprot:CEM33028.1 unnamed protein product [Vitrella brassicaformis CCMP3155]